MTDHELLLKIVWLLKWAIGLCVANIVLGVGDLIMKVVVYWKTVDHLTESKDMLRVSMEANRSTANQKSAIFDTLGQVKDATIKAKAATEAAMTTVQDAKQVVEAVAVSAGVPAGPVTIEPWDPEKPGRRKGDSATEADKIKVAPPDPPASSGGVVLT